MRRVVACGFIALSIVGVMAGRASADQKAPAWDSAQVGEVTVAPNPAPPGTKYAVVVKVKNTGSSAWTPKNVSATVRTTTGSQITDVSPTTVIKPGETFEVAVELTAGSTPGTEFIDIEMRHNGRPYLSDQGVFFERLDFGTVMHAQVTVASAPVACNAGGAFGPTCAAIAPGTIGTVQTAGVGTFMVADLTNPETVLTGVGPTATPLTFTTVPGDLYQLSAGPATTMTLG
jgi:hypothetical protein